MHAVILAGGKGVRLRPYTTVAAQAAGADRRPALDPGDHHAPARRLRLPRPPPWRSATSATLIRAYVGDGSQWGLDASTTPPRSRRWAPSGRCCDLRDRLPEHFLVMNGDILTDLDYADLLHRHRDGGAELTVATYARAGARSTSGC